MMMSRIQLQSLLQKRFFRHMVGDLLSPVDYYQCMRPRGFGDSPKKVCEKEQKRG